MARRPSLAPTRIWPVLVLIVVQGLCTLVFVGDLVRDMLPQGWPSLSDPAIYPEMAATMGLILGILFEVAVLWHLLGQQARMQQSLSVASGALAEVMAGYFRSWGLTPTEQDVAGFTIKGYSIAEIAKLRGSAEGTIKTHLNAIYRKSGVAGRSQLVSVLVEDLFQAPMLPETPIKPAKPALAT